MLNTQNNLIEQAISNIKDNTRNTKTNLIGIAQLNAIL